jgi:hypothetical protein
MDDPTLLSRLDAWLPRSLAEQKASFDALRPRSLETLRQQDALFRTETDIWLKEIVDRLAEANQRGAPDHAGTLLQGYTLKLYHALLAHDAAATTELWQHCYHLAHRRHAPDADEVAQETIVHVLEGVASLQRPSFLLWWTARILDTVRRVQRAELGAVSSISTAALQNIEDLRDCPSDMVECALITKELLALVRGCLADEVSKTIIFRTILGDDRDVDVARELQLRIGPFRTIKARATRTLARDKHFRPYLRVLHRDF